MTCFVKVVLAFKWLNIPNFHRLFEAEAQDLFLDLQSLPRNAALRKLNDLIKRARLAKVKIACLARWLVLLGTQLDDLALKHVMAGNVNSP